MLLPPKFDIIDISLREPVTHMNAEFPVDRKLQILKVLLSEVKPMGITFQAVYNADDAPSLRYWQRDIHDMEK